MDRANDGQPKPTEIFGIKSPSKRQLAADDADCFEPVAKRIRHQQQQVVLDAAGPQRKRVRFDSVALVTEVTEKPPINHAREFEQESYDKWVLSATARTSPVPRKPQTRKGPTEKTRPAPSCPRSFSSQPKTSNEYPFLALSRPKDNEWKQKEDKYLLDAAKRRDSFSVMSRTLVRSEEACRKRVAHLARVLHGRLAGCPGGVDEELLGEIKQEILQRSRVPSEEASGGDEGEDDNIMKLVIWKFYQRQDVLDPAVIERHEGLREELDGIEWMDSQLLKTAASIFLKRRAKNRGQ